MRETGAGDIHAELAADILDIAPNCSPSCLLRSCHRGNAASCKARTDISCVALNELSFTSEYQRSTVVPSFSQPCSSADHCPCETRHCTIWRIKADAQASAQGGLHQDWTTGVTNTQYSRYSTYSKQILSSKCARFDCFGASISSHKQACLELFAAEEAAFHLSVDCILCCPVTIA